MLTLNAPATIILTLAAEHPETEWSVFNPLLADLEEPGLRNLVEDAVRVLKDEEPKSSHSDTARAIAASYKRWTVENASSLRAPRRR